MSDRRMEWVEEQMRKPDTEDKQVKLLQQIFERLGMIQNILINLQGEVRSVESNTRYVRDNPQLYRSI